VKVESSGSVEYIEEKNADYSYWVSKVSELKSKYGVK
jgi:hypothetical protein